MHFGRVSVCGRSRVPRPAASSIAFKNPTLRHERCDPARARDDSLRSCANLVLRSTANAFAGDSEPPSHRAHGKMSRAHERRRTPEHRSPGGCAVYSAPAGKEGGMTLRVVDRDGSPPEGIFSGGRVVDASTGIAGPYA